MKEALPIAVFASGGGTNFQSLLDYEHKSSYNIVLLITDQQNVGALERAEKSGKQTKVIKQSGRSDQKIGLEIQSVLEESGIEFIVLAGYLKKIPDLVVSLYPRRIVNIHPALLPSFGGKGMYGKYVHEAVLESEEKFTGPTVHYVDHDYDTGEIIAQVPVPVLDGDDWKTLGRRVLHAEHQLYPSIVDQLCKTVVAESGDGKKSIDQIQGTNSNA